MNNKNKKEENSEDKPVFIRNTTDLQRLKLEKLMKNPDKPVLIPEKPKGRSMPPVPDFVRNVMGSSAGAGSGEFHVYRHLRRKEYARQKFIQEKSEREKLDEEYHNRLTDNKRKLEAKTAKKRAKRQKRKMKLKQKGRKNMKKEESSSESSVLDETDEESCHSNDDENKDTDKSTIACKPEVKEDIEKEHKGTIKQENIESPVDDKSVNNVDKSNINLNFDEDKKVSIDIEEQNVNTSFSLNDNCIDENVHVQDN